MQFNYRILSFLALQVLRFYGAMVKGSTFKHKHIRFDSGSIAKSDLNAKSVVMRLQVINRLFTINRLYLVTSNELKTKSSVDVKFWVAGWGRTETG